jgi:hypothetical protein
MLARASVVTSPFVGGGPINVMLYGAKGDGVTDDTAAIVAAITAMVAGDRLYFPRGTYPISAQISLKGDAVYDMQDASFYATTGVSYLFRATSVSNCKIIGGTFIYVAGLSATVTQQSVVYSAGTAIGTSNCVNVEVYGQTFLRVAGGVRFEDSTDCWAHHTYSKEVLAPLVVAVLSVFAHDTERITVSDNISYQSGDDYIAVLIQGGAQNLRHITIKDNFCDGSGIHFASSGLIRVGRYGGTGSAYDINVISNKMIGMNSQGFYLHNCTGLVVSNNSVVGYAVYANGAAFTIGITSSPVSNVVFSGNTASGPSNSFVSWGIQSADMTYSNVFGNQLAGNYAGRGNSFDNCQMVRISNNTFTNEVVSGGSSVGTQSGSDYLNIFDNDLSSGDTRPIFSGSGNSFSRNYGYDASENVSYEDDYVMFDDAIVTY